MILIANDRCKSSSNPLGLDIGDQIVTSHVSNIDYIDNKKVIIKTEGQKTLRIIGLVRKATGVYSKGSSNPFNPEDYEQASLVVDKYYWFYQARLSLHKPTYLIQASDITNHHYQD